MFDLPLALRVTARFMRRASYFSLGDLVTYGKYKNHKGKIVGFGSDKWGNPTVEVEPVPKGRKQNKTFGLFKIWRADVKEKALAEQAKNEGKQATEDDEPLDDNDDEEDSYGMQASLSQRIVRRFLAKGA